MRQRQIRAARSLNVNKQDANSTHTQTHMYEISSATTHQPHVYPSPHLSLSPHKQTYTSTHSSTCLGVMETGKHGSVRVRHEDRQTVKEAVKERESDTVGENHAN